MERQSLADSKDGKNPEDYKEERKKLEAKQKLELKQNDMKIAMQIDQKVSDQQVLLEKAGVPGFYVTNVKDDVRVQMYLLEFIIKLNTTKLPKVEGLD